MPQLLLFPKLKRPMKRRHFATIEEIKEKSKKELSMTTSKNGFQKYFVDWKKWLHKCIMCEGVTFEGTR